MPGQLTYLACPYSHRDRAVRVARFEAANRAAAKLMAAGELVFSPISHTHPIAEAGGLPGDWCTPRYTPIWMGDYSFCPIGQVRVGDEVIGWETETKDAHRSKQKGAYYRTVLRRAVVGRVGWRPAQPLVKLTMSSGAYAICTPSHKWLTVHGGKSCNKFKFSAVKIGDKLCRVVEPTAMGGSNAAWLGGLYDGEGTGDRIAQCSIHNPLVYERIRQVLCDLGLEHREMRKKSRPPYGWRIADGRAGCARFAALCRPIRYRSLDQIILTAKFRKPDAVVSIEVLDEDDVFSLQTSTGNYTAWGYASKNSYWERYDRAMLDACKQIVVLMLDGWRESVGIQAEIGLAWRMGLPVEYMEPER